MKPFVVEGSTYIDESSEKNGKDPKFKVCDHKRISNLKDIFAKGNTPNFSEEVFVIIKVKYTMPWTLMMRKTLIYEDLNIL